MDWPVEAIPDDDLLYKRVHENFITRNGIEPGTFANRPKGDPWMSVDWAKYSTPEETRKRGKEPSRNAVIGALAGEVRAIPGQIVEHLPTKENRSHSGVTGQKTARVRLELSRLFGVIIPLEHILNAT
jgi:hypothetical protein